jgi:hypothetical protein
VEPYRLRFWRVPTGRLATCGRPGRSKYKDASRVPDKITHEWVRNLPGPNTVVVSLLGKKPDGTSEFSFYPFYGGFDRAEEQRGRVSFQEWLGQHHPLGPSAPPIRLNRLSQRWRRGPPVNRVRQRLDLRSAHRQRIVL